MHLSTVFEFNIAHGYDKDDDDDDVLETLVHELLSEVNLS